MANKPLYFEDDGSILRAMNLEQFSDEAVRKFSIIEDRRKVIFLVDVQGIYLKLISWMRENQVPLEGGELIGNIAASLIYETAQLVEQRDTAEFFPRGIDYRTFDQWVIYGNDDKIRSVRKVDRWVFQAEIFFAPSPLPDIKSKIENARRNGNISSELSELESRLNAGMVPVHGKCRDYRYYDDFVKHLKICLDVRRSEKGFYNYSIGKDGLRYFDEKEVDIRIAIRAMDIMQGEADAICIVSSDQDFAPLHERCRDGGLRTYHADVAKFDAHRRIGRKITDLGEDAIFVTMPKEMSGDIIYRHIHMRPSERPHYIDLTRSELNGLLDLYERVNGRRWQM